jgi:hypothetical protein
MEGSGTSQFDVKSQRFLVLVSFSVITFCSREGSEKKEYTGTKMFQHITMPLYREVTKITHITASCLMLRKRPLQQYTYIPSIANQ